MFISYGLQSNDSLLQYYGFVEPDIPHDTYVVPDLAAVVTNAVPSAGLPARKACLTSVPSVCRQSMLYKLSCVLPVWPRNKSQYCLCLSCEAVA